MNRPRQSKRIAGAMLCRGNAPRTQPERASEYVADCQESTFFLLSALDVGDDAVNVKLDNSFFAFVAEE